MTKRKPITLESPGVIVLLDLIKSHPGLFLRDLMQRSGYSISHTKNALSFASSAGLVAPVYTDGCKCAWYTADIARPLIERWKQRHEIARNEALSRREQREATHAAAKAEKASQQAARRAAIPMTARDRISIMSQRPEGVSAAAIMAEVRIPLNSLTKHCRVLVQRGRLFKADRQGARLRWFDTAERAQEWAAMPPMEPSEWSAPGFKAWADNDRPRSQKEANREAARQVRLVAIGERLKNSARQPSKAPPKLAGSDQGKYEAIKAKPAQPAPVTLHGKPSDMRGTVDYSRAKITICPAPVSVYRYQYDPTSDAHRAYVRQLEQLRGAA